MLLKLRARAHVDVRSKGLVAALDHAVSFAGDVDPWELDVGDGGEIDVEVKATLAVAKLEPPESASWLDRRQMNEQLAAALEASRWPEVGFVGRYRGTLTKGRLEGVLAIRGERRPIAFEVKGDDARVTAVWEGALTELGVKPPKGLLGAMRMADWGRIRIEVMRSA
jgi:hypothetical protein